MQPTGIEPALKASEAFVLSVRLRLQDCNIRIYYKNPKRKQERKNSVSGRTIVLLFLTIHHPRILQHQRKNQIIMSGYLGAAANITLMLVAAV